MKSRSDGGEMSRKGETGHKPMQMQPVHECASPRRMGWCRMSWLWMVRGLDICSRESARGTRATDIFVSFCASFSSPPLAPGLPVIGRSLNKPHRRHLPLPEHHPSLPPLAHSRAGAAVRKMTVVSGLAREEKEGGVDRYACVRGARREGGGGRGRKRSRAEQADEGRHRRSSPSMAQRSSLHLSAGLAATTAYAGARSVRRSVRSIGKAGGEERAEMRQAWVGSEDSGM
ncbi:hypothetical protein B0H13DRAFT_2030138 [Mycena leptocephala]|nr:hypothetical protein B0H13DRAFT_2030138 [Mycena leptocephala]